MYGVIEQGNIADAAYTSDAVDYSEVVELDDRRLVRVDRVRLLTDPGCPFLDLSYCWGTLRDGRHVQVFLERSTFGRRTYKSEIVALAQASHVYAKGLGLLDNISILWG